MDNKGIEESYKGSLIKYEPLEIVNSVFISYHCFVRLVFLNLNKK